METEGYDMSFTFRNDHLPSLHRVDNRSSMIHSLSAPVDQRVLCVSPYPEDHANLKRILSGKGWRIQSAHSCLEAIDLLDWHEDSIAAVICEQNLPDGDWRDMSGRIADSSACPPLIVASSLANAPLWLEILNLGGADLLGKPFRAGEVLWALGSASTRKKPLAQARISR